MLQASFLQLENIVTGRLGQILGRTVMSVAQPGGSPQSCLAHLAGIDELSRREMAVESAQNIVTLYQGNWPEGSVVNAELKEGWRW